MVSCNKCSSTNVHKKEVRGSKRRFKCNDCKARFYADEYPLKTYIITSAQSNTPVDAPFLKSLKRYCSHNNAELLVVPFQYKNPTSVFENKDTLSWDESVIEFLVDDRRDLNTNISVCGEVKIQPTAVRPLSGLDTYNKTKSCVFGHVKHEYRTVAACGKKLPKVLTTTGACTVANYTASKAGMKAQFNHKLGACVVTINGRKEFHIRQVSSNKDGSFTDIDKVYHPNKSPSSAPNAAALVLGDFHFGSTDPKVEMATLFSKDSIFAALTPDRLVFHDLMDFYNKNHHHRGDFLLEYRKQLKGKTSVKDEIIGCMSKLKDISELDSDVYIVKSNHDEAFDRWIKETDPRTDVENLEIWCETTLALIGGAKCSLSHWFNKLNKNVTNVKFLQRDDELLVDNVDMSEHGDKGVNGARGSAVSLSKTARKKTIGHSHSPSIVDAVFTVGTSTHLQLEYNIGASTWLNTHCVQYADGHRTLISVIDGKWK